MWATFDYTKYETDAIVKVDFSNEINDVSFDAFLKSGYNYIKQNAISLLYLIQRRVGFVPLKYSIRMSSFIGKLKKMPLSILTKKYFYCQQQVRRTYD